MPVWTLEPPPLRSLENRSFHPWLVVGVTCIGAFIGQLDASIVQLALPTLTQAFDVSVSEVRWVAIAYLLAFAGSLGVFGRVCEMLGRKSLYLAGFFLFTAASLLCGWAEDLNWLILLRALQGIGGGLLGANSITILVKSVPLEKRAQAIGLFTTAQAIGVSTGPIVGGLLLDALGWRWVFWVAVPFGFFAFLFGWLVLPRTADRVTGRCYDWYGALLLLPSLVLAIVVLNQVSVWSLTSPAMVLCVAGSITFLLLFVQREKRADWPLVDLALFRSPGFASGISGVVLGYALLYGMLFLVSFVFVKGLDNSGSVAGIKLSVIPIALGLIAPLGITYSERFTTRRVGAAGMSVCIVAITFLAVIAFELDRPVIRLIALATFGVGLGLFMAPNSHATIAAAPASHAATAGALVNLARIMGSCIGVSAASSMLAWHLPHHLGAKVMGAAFIDAVQASLLMLAAFAFLAASTSLAFPRPRAPLT
jgi:EmrB/QacA subfamily drug resistance transporter